MAETAPLKKIMMKRENGELYDVIGSFLTTDDFASFSGFLFVSLRAPDAFTVF